MAIAFTICSNNYLAQASVLGKSLKVHDPDMQFFTILVDEKSDLIDYSQLPFTCIPIKDIEPNIEGLMELYNIVELNTCVKPEIFRYFFANYADPRIIYLDPDIEVYNSLKAFDTYFEESDILLTPHIYTPIEIDGESPSENTFLNYGIYNLGFIAVQKSDESLRFMNWWKDRTYKKGYARICDGIYVDQLYISLVPVLFKKVHILTDMGYNMAPWNLHERYLTKQDGRYLVNGKETLKFFHFSSFKIDSGELPVVYYTRFKMAQRPDLAELYADYNKALNEAGYPFFKKIKCVYYEKYHSSQKERKALEEQKAWQAKSGLNRFFIKIVNLLPQPVLAKVRMSVNEQPPGKN